MGCLSRWRLSGSAKKPSECHYRNARDDSAVMSKSKLGNEWRAIGATAPFGAVGQRRIAAVEGRAPFHIAAHWVATESARSLTVRLTLEPADLPVDDHID